MVKEINYYYLIMSENDILENQVIEEIIRERDNYYLGRKKLKDFWILHSIDFIQSESFDKKVKETNFYKNLSNKNLYTLISLDKDFIKWFALRLGYFEDINTKIINKTFKSDGITGTFILNKEEINNSPLYYKKDNYSELNLLKKYKKFINIYYNK